MRLLSFLGLPLIVLSSACNGPETKHSDSEAPDDSTPLTADADGDGYCSTPTASADCPAEPDCDDADANVNPGATEVWYDGVDQDCDGNDDDYDGDGSASTEAGGDDCDDLDAAVNPSAAEDCSTPADDNCDGLTDSEDALNCTIWYSDTDGDGYGELESCSCEPPAGSASTGGDCNDGDAAINPGAAELCDALDVDEDCDGFSDDADPEGAEGQISWYTDNDADGHGAGAENVSCELPSGASLQNDDCDDSDSGIFPGAFEIPGDGIDSDCDGSDEDSGSDDADGDGWTSLNDCDDNDATINPGAAELCDGIDQDCDGTIDDGAVATTPWYADNDHDGYGDPNLTSYDCIQPADYVADGTDCDDGDATINPAAVEVLSDGIDQDCDGADDVSADGDGDGYDSVNYGGTDCDDNDASINPAATEICDDIDNNCDGSVDEGLMEIWYSDADSDGYGDANNSEESCYSPNGYVQDSSDCNDLDATINPGATEVCDGIDNDCDGLTDDLDGSVDPGTYTTWYADGDGDGFGDPNLSTASCAAPAGSVEDASDCNDSDAAINPVATEICDALDVDENCNGVADDADPGVDIGGYSSWWIDTDGDTFGSSTGVLSQCNQPSGYVLADASQEDCNDGNASINPAATEICDGADTDEDCDGAADDADSNVDSGTFTTWYADSDSDGFASASVTVQSCDLPAGYLEQPVAAEDYDCNDADAAINPAALEICDPSNVDENCNGVSDDDDTGVASGSLFTWYQDSDGDGFGSLTETYACEQPVGFVADSTDCHDGDAAINPAAQEICDGQDVDEDCDGVSDDFDNSVDSGTFSTWYRDADNDGYGNLNDTIQTCDLPPGYLADSSDCNDGDSAISPAAQELCDAADIDEDCNGFADNDDPDISESVQVQQWGDADGDGYGDPADFQPDCDILPGTALNDGDCDDSRVDVNPSAYEVCDGSTDEDCDTLVDDDDPDTLSSSKTTWYADADADGYGDDNDPGTLMCVAPVDTVSVAGDCDDTDSAINPAAQEICDGADTDEDCDGAADDDDASATGQTTFYLDSDGDGYGDEDSTMQRCDEGGGYISGAGDCDDGDSAINPDATEICENGVDENCETDCRDTDYAFDTAADETYLGLSNGSTTSGGFLGANLVGGKDIDGDGYVDVAIADRLYDGSTASATLNIGKVYLLSGDPAGLQGSTSSPTAAITGELAGDRMGGGVGMVWDVDNDGDDELVTGAYLDNVGTATDAGSAFLYRGPLTSTTLLPANANITINGIAGNDYTGWLVNGAGDLTNDGVEDWVISAYFAKVGSSNRVGRVSIVSGTLANGTYTTSSITTQIEGTAADQRLGSAMVTEEDLNGDNVPDLLLMALGSSTAYGFYGPLSGSLTTADYDFSVGGITQLASSNETQSPYGLASGGDNDGDGYTDLIIGSDGYDGSFTDTGAAWLLLGPFTSNISSASASAEASVNGILGSDFAGRSVGLAGDVDGDGFDDFLVGAPGFDLISGEGAGVLVYGPSTGSLGVTSPNVSATVGTIASGSLGTCVGGVGDVDDDGFDDYMLGAPNDTTGGTVKLGKAFLYYGTGE